MIPKKYSILNTTPLTTQFTLECQEKKLNKLHIQFSRKLNECNLLKKSNWITNGLNAYNNLKYFFHKKTIFTRTHFTINSNIISLKRNGSKSLNA